MINMDHYNADILYLNRKVYTPKVKMKRLAWDLTWKIFIRPCPRWGLKGWRRFLYRLFGAKIPKTSGVHPSAKVFMPWNLELGEYSVIASSAIIYNPAPVILRNACVVSERSFLCTASHNIHSMRHEQIERPIVVNNRAWVAAEAFVGPGVTIGEGAVVGARGCVFKDVEPWTVVGGNPARILKKRIIIDGESYCDCSNHSDKE